jgi:hypothetical protein
VGHRLEHAERQALAVGGEDHDRGAAVQALELLVRDEAQRSGDEVSQRAVAGDDEVHAAGRLDELENPLLAREPSREEHLGR